MREWQGKRYWLVGASEGLGLALAQKLSRAGAELILSARTRAPLDKAAATVSGPVSVVECDVAQSSAVKAAAAQIGPVDGVVFLAGVYWPMSAKSLDADQLEAMCDVNFTGCARVLAEVVPQMVARNQGHIVLTGSLAGFRGLPGAMGYAAAKAGVMALAESLYCDLRKTGVQVQMANPGYIRTRLTKKNDFSMPMLMEPEAAAQSMFEHMNSDRFSKSFPAPFAWLFRLTPLMPTALYFRLFGRSR